MKTKKKHNWAILGCGNIARKFSSDLKLLENANLYATASRRLEKAQDFAKEFGFDKSYGSYEEMISDPNVDIVYIATPHSHHLEHSLLCLNHKKAVICEKAFAINTKEVEQMIAASKENNTFLMEAFWTRFNPSFLKVLEIIQSKELGDLKTVKCDFMFNAPFDPNHRLFNMGLGGGSLLDIGIYPVFTALMTLGIPKDIIATAILSETGSDNYLNMQFSYNDNKNAVLTSGLTCDAFNDSEFYFEKGSIRISREYHRQPVIAKKGILEEIAVENGPGFGYQKEAAHVMDCLDKGLKESPMLPLSFSLDLIKTLDLIRKKTGIIYPNHD
jgi:predicted dehydrogenase